MSIFLSGAGPAPGNFPELFGRFVQEVQVQSGAGLPARVAVAVHHRGGSPAEILLEYAEPLLARAPIEVVPVLFKEGRPVDPAVFGGVHGVVVGGGLTPAYWEGLNASAPAISQVVAGGTPYLGFSAGAMVAPGRAVLGGYLINGVEAAPGDDGFEVLGSGNSWDIRRAGTGCSVSVPQRG